MPSRIGWGTRILAAIVLLPLAVVPFVLSSRPMVDGFGGLGVIGFLCVPVMLWLTWRTRLVAIYEQGIVVKANGLRGATREVAWPMVKEINRRTRVIRGVKHTNFDIVVGDVNVTISPNMDGKACDEALAAIARLAGLQWHGDSAYRIARLR
jgi:hypothetical protein